MHDCICTIGAYSVKIVDKIIEMNKFNSIIDLIKNASIAIIFIGGIIIIEKIIITAMTKRNGRNKHGKN